MSKRCRNIQKKKEEISRTTGSSIWQILEKYLFSCDDLWMLLGHLINVQFCLPVFFLWGVA
jgi:hypothetical protein